MEHEDQWTRIENEAREWKIARDWGVDEEAWADVQIERRMSAFFENIL